MAGMKTRDPGPSAEIADTFVFSVLAVDRYASILVIIVPYP